MTNKSFTCSMCGDEDANYYTNGGRNNHLLEYHKIFAETIRRDFKTKMFREVEKYP